MTAKDLTIVITTYKSEKTVEDCLNSIEPNIKVILIENSNNQRFKTHIEDKFSNVECFLTNDNLGYGKANNIGLKKVKTKYALILNPDTFLESSTLDEFLKISKSLGSFAIIGPYIQEQNHKKENRDENKLLVSENKLHMLHLKLSALNLKLHLRT